MNDLVERKAVLEMLNNSYVREDNKHYWRDHNNDCIDRLIEKAKAMPSADAVSREDYEVMQFCFEQMKFLAYRYMKLAHSVRLQGEWINLKISISGDSSAECSLCGAVVHNNFSNVINFCPNCGADMRGINNVKD